MPPEITVGICAYNEEKNIGNLLGEILNKQNLNKNYEILVVCSGCTDDTVEIVKGFQKQSSKIRILIESERKGKASAINHILSEARGNAIIFISADTLPNRECFNRLLSKLEHPKVGIVCGNPIPINSTKTLVGKLVHLLWDFHDIVFRFLDNAGLARHATEVFCIRKEIIGKIPNETINDDAYIALTTKKRGWLIEYEPSAKVSICGPQIFYDYFLQRRRILVGHLQVKKLTGEPPQHLIYLLPKQPIQVFKLWLLLFKNNNFVTVLTFLSIELMTNCCAAIDYLRKKSYTKWVISNSTKEMIDIQNNSVKCFTEKSQIVKK